MLSIQYHPFLESFQRFLCHVWLLENGHSVVMVDRPDDGPGYLLSVFILLYYLIFVKKVTRVKLVDDISWVQTQIVLSKSDCVRRETL
jgi:hypothetical protein